MKFKVDVNVISVENVPSKAERVVVSVARGPKMRTTKDAMLFDQEGGEGDGGGGRKGGKPVPRSFKTATWVRRPAADARRRTRRPLCARLTAPPRRARGRDAHRTT